jgi:signal transduction histidine kinase
MARGMTQAPETIELRPRDRDEEQRRFLATAAHQLRTPLTSLHVMLGLLEDALNSDAPDLADAREQVARATAQSARITALCRQLLDLSRLDGGAPLRRRRVELRAVARAVIAEFPDAVERVDIATETAVWAVADPDAVAQVLRILLDNALRFAPARTRVTVRLRDVGSHAGIAVCNFGPAIPAQDRDRIFERFERGSAAEAASGFGLGLAIGRELARRMGGDLRLDRAPTPTCFVLVLPTGRPGRRRSG